MALNLSEFKQKILSHWTSLKTRIVSIFKKYVYLAAIVILILVGIFIVIYNTVNPQFDSILFLSGLSTYVIALFTATYAYTSSRQVDLMITQISEMKKDRELQSQPMPWLEKFELIVNKPHFFYTPIEQEYSSHSQCFFFFILKNVGATPAVSIDVQGRILLDPKDKSEDKSKVLGPDVEKIEILEEKQIAPKNFLDKIEDLENREALLKKRANMCHLMYNDDKKIKLLDMLLERNIDKTPIFQYRTVFRNIVGGKFLILQSYLLFIYKDEDLETLKKWICARNTFPITFKDELAQLERLRKMDLEKWDKLYNEVKKKFEDSLEQDEIEIFCDLIPQSIKVTPISNEVYTGILEESKYGLPSVLVKSRCEGCTMDTCSKIQEKIG